MVEWRARGVVKDSDDEEEIEDLRLVDKVLAADEDRQFSADNDRGVLNYTAADTQGAVCAPGQPGRKAGGTHGDDDVDELQADPVYAKSSKALAAYDIPNDGDLMTGVELHNSNTLDIFDIPSSPLSDPPPTPRTRPVVPPSYITPNTDHLTFANSFSTSTTHGCIGSSPQTALHDARLGRQLRRRNPIQLHPYLLENEQYRQTLRARGLRPIAFASGESQQDVETNETQNQDGHYSQSSQSSALLGASSQTSQAPSAGAGADWGDDLPDLETLMNSRKVGAHRVGDTRRSVHSATQAGGLNPVNREISRQQPPLDSVTELNHARSVFDVPPSPQTMTPLRSRLKKHRYRKFRMPVDLVEIPTALRLPTPQASPEVNQALENFLRLGSDSEDDTQSSVNRHNIVAASETVDLSGSRHAAVLDLPELSSSGASTDSDEERIRVTRQARKFRGVLPASYVRVVQQPYKSPRSIHDDGESPPPSSHTRVPQRGIAKRINGSSRPNVLDLRSASPPSHLIEISDDSDTHYSHTRSPPRLSAKASVNLSHSMLLDDFGQVEEDDWIDPMLPGNTRNKKLPPVKRKRQLRLSETFQPSKRRVVEAPSHKTQQGHARYTVAAENSNARRRPVQRWSGAPRRSILDAPEVHQQKPDFLKVAIRQARSRPDNGRHSPSRKIISLQNQAHGAETDAVLRAWKRGDIKRDKTYDARMRSNLNTTVPRRPPVDRPLNPQTLNRAAVVLSHSRGDKNFSAVAAITGTSTVRQTQLEHPIVGVRAPPTHPKAGHDRQGAEAITAGLEERERPRVPRRLRPVVRGRPGQLEGAESEIEVSTGSVSIRGRLDALEAEEAPARNPLLLRYLAENHGLCPEPSRNTLNLLSGHSAPVVRIIPAKPRRARKRPPKWVDVSMIDLHQLQDEDTICEELLDVRTDPAQSLETRIVEGLGPFGTVYPTTFDTSPFVVGTYFHESTFIGSGRLHDCLRPISRDMDEAHGFAQIDLAGRVFTCGPWTADVSTLIEDVCSTATDFETVSLRCIEVPSLLRSILDYMVNNLSFLDPIDRQTFATTMTKALETLVEGSLSARRERDTLRTCAILTLLASRAGQIIDNPLVQASCQSKLQSLEKMSTQRTFAVVLDQMQELRRLISDMRKLGKQEGGIRNGEPVAEALVTLAQLADQSAGKLDFWATFNDAILRRLRVSSYQVSVHEETWQDLFTVLPFLEFGSDGVIENGKRFKASMDNWVLVKTLLERLFTAYDRLDGKQVASMNTYFRAVLGRCHHLIRQWGWQRSEVILGSIFDYFGRRAFSFLPNEEVRGSPSFLEVLDEDSLPSIEPADRSFHIFLKALRTGLVRMKKTYTSKKLSNIAWRFIPNHDRSHQKDNCLKQEDLEALRNQHDLLVVLYCSLPEPSRPNINLIRKLVDFQSSHSEVCRLNVRAWANLVNFHLTCAGESAVIAPFSAWFNDNVAQLIQQHRNARAEGESVAEATRNDGTNTVDRGAIESMVVRNQVQLESVLISLLGELKHALREPKNVSAAISLFEECSMPQALQLFDPKHSRLNAVVDVALDVYSTFVTLVDRETTSTAVPHPQTSEDSQEYGGWPDDMDLTDLPDTGVGGLHPIAASVVEPLWSLVSNCFGTERPVTEIVKTRLVTAWVAAARASVRAGHRDWNYYLGQYGAHSWSQLRKTDQTRQYLPYYLSLIVESDSSSLGADMTGIISSWLVSLTERDAALKFQHRLTTALLNENISHPLLHNLPFVRMQGKERYDIDLDTLRQRRLALFSTVLENMRNTYDDALLMHGHCVQIRSDYIGILKSLMLSMKTNYQELNLGTTALRGAYVDFAQKLVEFMQQYTNEICSIDKFFVDSAAFPLPTTDPTYVVGRLKGYGRGLKDPKTQKKLVVFMQNVCERAALEGQQVYLCEQLTKSVGGSFIKDISRPSLRTVLLEVILPAYLEVAFTTDCGWVLTLPLLDAVTIVFRKLIFSFDLNDVSVAESVSGTCSIVLVSISSTIASAIARDDTWNKPSALKTISALFSICTAMLTPLDYLVRSRKVTTESIVRHKTNLTALARYVVARLSNSDGRDASNSAALNTLSDSPETPFEEMRNFCNKELRDTLTRNWTKDGSKYSVVRGSTRREVVVDVGLWEEEREGVLKSVEAYMQLRSSMPPLGRLGRLARQRPSLSNSTGGVKCG